MNILFAPFHFNRKTHPTNRVHLFLHGPGVASYKILCLSWILILRTGVGRDCGNHTALLLLIIDPCVLGYPKFYCEQYHSNGMVITGLHSNFWTCYYSNRPIHCSINYPTFISKLMCCFVLSTERNPLFYSYYSISMRAASLLDQLFHFIDELVLHSFPISKLSLSILNRPICR
jgi:hypothetical protein